MAKPGQASKLAKLMKEVMAGDPNFKGRILTDFVGNYNTVVVEADVENLTAWEKQMEEYKSAPKVESTTENPMAGYTEMYLTGRREIWQVI